MLHGSCRILCLRSISLTLRSISKPHQKVTLQNSSRCLATNVGDKASLSKAFSEEDVKKFADICLDHNPIHQDKAYAAKTKFGKPIVHGVLNIGCVLYEEQSISVMD